MIGQKTLEQIRLELEAAVGHGPIGDGSVAESLRRFLASWPRSGDAPSPNHERNPPVAEAPHQPPTPGR